MATSEPAKTITLRIRVDPGQRRDLEFAARHHHLELSTWMRQFCLDEAARIKAVTQAADRRAARRRGR